jgi:hypothetical protein
MSTKRGRYLKADDMVESMRTLGDSSRIDRR